MPDKKIDEQMIDRAWEQMHLLLDKEMPAKRKRRRAAVIWLPLLGAAAAIGLVWFYFLNPVLPPPDKTSAPIAAIDKNTSEGKPSHRNQSADHTAKRAVQNILDAAEQPVSRSKKTDSPSLQSNQNRTYDTQQEILQPPLVPAVGAATTVAATTNPITTIALKKFSIAYKTAPSLDRSMLPLPLILPHDKTGALRLGAEAGVQAGNFTAVEGFVGGMALSYPSKNQKWALRSGMTFSAQRRFIMPGDMAQAAFESSANDPGQGGSFVNAAPNIGDRTLHFQLYQLGVPLVMSTKLNKRFALEGGAQAAYLLSATNLEGVSAEVRNSLNIAAAEPLNKLYADLSASENTQKIEIDALNRWEVSLLVGASYQMYEHWTLRFQYQQGVRDIVKNTDFQSFNSNFNLSAVYYFK